MSLERRGALPMQCIFGTFAEVALICRANEMSYLDKPPTTSKGTLRYATPGAAPRPTAVPSTTAGRGGNKRVLSRGSGRGVRGSVPTARARGSK